MGRSGNFDEIANLFMLAADSREFTSLEAWAYGWYLAEYRHSGRAALAHDGSHQVCLSAGGVEAYERGMDQLFKIGDIRELYSSEELWGIVAQLVGELPMSGKATLRKEELTRRLARLTSPPDAAVVAPIANLDPGDTTLDAGPLIIGRLGPEWRRQFAARAGAQEAIRGAKPWWESLESDNREHDVVLLAHFGRSQLGRAIRDAEETFETLVSLALVMETDLDGRELYSLRGDSHRPGIRGLAVDRQALQQQAKAAPCLARELGADVLISGVLGRHVTHRWLNEKAFPLHELLAVGRLDEARRILNGSTKIHRRLKVAARWHAKAFWSEDVEDAVLALGISFDALLSEASASPGRVLAERYALIDPNPANRAARYKIFMDEYYGARSSVAHGARKSGLDGNFVRQMAKDLRETFRSVSLLTKTRAVATEDAFAEMFTVMKWGTQT